MKNRYEQIASPRYLTAFANRAAESNRNIGYEYPTDLYHMSLSTLIDILSDLKTLIEHNRFKGTLLDNKIYVILNCCINQSAHLTPKSISIIFDSLCTMIRHQKIHHTHGFNLWFSKWDALLSPLLRSSLIAQEDLNAIFDHLYEIMSHQQGRNTVSSRLLEQIIAHANHLGLSSVYSIDDNGRFIRNQISNGNTNTSTEYLQNFSAYRPFNHTSDMSSHTIIPRDVAEEMSNNRMDSAISSTQTTTSGLVRSDMPGIFAPIPKKRTIDIAFDELEPVEHIPKPQTKKQKASIQLKDALKTHDVALLKTILQSITGIEISQTVIKKDSKSMSNRSHRPGIRLFDSSSKIDSQHKKTTSISVEVKEYYSVVSSFLNEMMQNRPEFIQTISDINNDFFEVLILPLSKAHKLFYNLIDGGGFDLVLKHLSIDQLEPLIDVCLSPLCLHINHAILINVISTLDRRKELTPDHQARIQSLQNKLYQKGCEFHGHKENAYGTHIKVLRELEIFNQRRKMSDRFTLSIEQDVASISTPSSMR